METQAQQSKGGVFQDLDYREGQIFKRLDSMNYELGYSTYTGENYENCDGVVMKFNDGKEVLSDFCELINIDCPYALWAVTRDIESIEKSAKEKTERIVEEYYKIKSL